MHTAQQTIVDYVTSGGNAVIYPYLPDRELSQKPCTVLRDAISVSPSGTEVIDSPLIDILGLRDIKCSNPLITFSEEVIVGSGNYCRGPFPVLHADLRSLSEAGR
ncbi:MAG: hypothetical protein MZV63_69145 [Marinilabiliales bacterium]|nr:hypothetical protein [Marinilabiliales bacterium]